MERRIRQRQQLQQSEYYENIFDGVSKGSGWYGVPASFSLDVMIGDGSLLGQSGLDDKTWTWDQFVDLLEKTKTDGKYGIAMIKPELLLKYVAESVYGQLVMKDGNSVSFDAQAFQAYMEKIKSLYDGGMATSEMMGQENTSFSPLSIDSPMNALHAEDGREIKNHAPFPQEPDRTRACRSNQAWCLV